MAHVQPPFAQPAHIAQIAQIRCTARMKDTYATRTPGAIFSQTVQFYAARRPIRRLGADRRTSSRYFHSGRVRARARAERRVRAER